LDKESLPITQLAALEQQENSIMTCNDCSY